MYGGKLSGNLQETKRLASCCQGVHWLKRSEVSTGNGCVINLSIILMQGYELLIGHCLSDIIGHSIHRCQLQPLSITGSKSSIKPIGGKK